MKILHSSDFHLVEEGDERWSALEETVRKAREYSVDALVISGDLFNSDTDSENLRPALRKIFDNTSFPTFIIPGNHDSKSFTAGLYFGENIRVLADPDWSKNIEEFEDFTIVGVPFEEMDLPEFRSRLRKIPSLSNKSKLTVLLYHGELLDVSFERNGFGPEDGRYMPSRLAIFQEFDIDYVLAGHFHQNFIVRSIGKNGFFVYPGSPVSITQKETGRRKVAIIQDKKPPKEVDVNTFHFSPLDIRLDGFESANPIELIKKELDNIDSNAHVLLRVGGTIAGSEIDLTNAIKDLLKNSGVPNSSPQFIYKDISRVTQHPVFHLFESKLLEEMENSTNEISSEEIEKIKVMFVNAMVDAGI